ncbi:MAG TPA: Lrp/AsnC family transcriptional regulator [Dehalococcoidia bacterium]
MSEAMRRVLEALEQDARLSPARLAKLTGLSEEEVRALVAEAERTGVIQRYKTVVNWDKLGDETVWAWVELKVQPQRDVGFQHIADRIARYPEARSVYLVSGTYDIGVLVTGKTMHDVSNFVAEKLATMEPVQSTVTHFIMRRYKEDGEILAGALQGDRLPVSF